MKFLSVLIIAITALLSIAAGLAKVMQAPQEVDFLKSAGLSLTLIVVFGLVQVLGGILLVSQKTRMVGAVLAASAFAVSTILIFMEGDLAFGLFSILPIALAGVIIYQSAKTTHNKSINTDASDAGAG